MLFLSYILDANTPTYGNRNRFVTEKKSAIANGDVANDTSIVSTVHIGTHIDMPYHFYEEGQTIEDFKSDFWIFKKPLVIEIKQDEPIIYDTLIEQLTNIEDAGYDLLLVKTGACYKREEEAYWNNNYGFHPDVYDYLSKKYKKLRVLGFDSISVSSFQDRMLGREAHLRFLNPAKPLLLLEDMDLGSVSSATSFLEVIIAPLRIAQCDGLPCTVMAKLDD